MSVLHRVRSNHQHMPPVVCLGMGCVCVAALCLGFIGVLMPCQIDRGTKRHIVSLMVHVVSHFEFDRLEAVAAL